MKEMKRRFLAMLLCFAMLLNVCPIIPAQASSSDLLTVMYDGDPVDSVVLPVNERIKLKADRALLGSGTYQWQILAYDTIWVDIADAEGKTVEISYAMIANLLENDVAVVRCKVTKGENVTYSSEVVITVDYDVATDSNAIEAEEETSSNAEEEETPSNARVASGSNADEDDEDEEPVAVSRVFRLLSRAVEGTTYGARTYGTAPTSYNVVINYSFKNGDIAADPYTATLAAGSDFSTMVTFPTVQGYLPYVDEIQQDSIELNYTEIGQNYTINVVYKPTNVNYTVIYYLQNLADDKYTEAERDTKQGLTKSIVPDVEKTYDGFVQLLYEKPEIAADGSTVVEVYYDRLYYLMNFDLGGGYGVEPIYARYESAIGDVGTPTKAGYTFADWSLDGTNVVRLPGTMPAENRTYHAVWTPNDTAKVTVVFWGENADDEEYSYIKSSVINVKPGTEFTYSEDGTLILDCKHVHTTDCYTTGNGNYYSLVETTKPTNSLTDAGNGIYTYTTGSGRNKQTHYYLNIGEKWYCAESGYFGGGGDTIKISYNCNHSHTDKCYMNGAGLDSSLWTFVKSDTVTVAADGSSVVNVYYDRTEKTLTFKYNYKNGTYQKTETITAKWGSDISEQYKAIAENAGSTFWAATDSNKGPYTNYFGIMPQTSATYYNRGNTGETGTMTYWGQDLNGEYTVKLFEVTGVGGYTVTVEDHYEFKGFTYDHGTSNGSSSKGATFYYTRNSYTLTFNDGYNDVKKETVKYEGSLSAYANYVPEVPEVVYETGSVTFGGWYLNPECTGAEYKLETHTMPADNVLLYAKWVPVTHTVSFYLDKDALDAGTKLNTHEDIIVPHGSMADPTPTDPENGSYTFVGWFYMENGVEKAFDFDNMPVTKDLQVYGKWSSNVPKEYTILYKIQDTDTEIAAPTTGSGLAGITKTFEAKGGSELYADYQEGYFPVVKSHSITLDIDATEENDTNVYTFWYVQKDAVPYTVKYLNEKTGEPVADEKTVSDNRKAVVTETFVPVFGMMPDAYQKRLVVSAEEGAVNEIIFYYVEDTTHAYYVIKHYTENLATDADGNTTWTEYASSEAVGDIGTTYTADPMTIPGFTYDSTVSGTVASGELTAGGLELKLYYIRNSYPYTVRYLEQGTNAELVDPKDGTGKYGQVISESAIDIADYDAVEPTSQTLNIRVEEGTKAERNIITFYYKEKEVTINYVAVPPTGASEGENFGSVSPESETVKVKNGTAQGSTPTVSESKYYFVGWYTDEACTQPVDSSLVDGNNKFVPAKVDDKNVAATYYAKFEYAKADLTITKAGQDVAETDTFLFKIKDSNRVEIATITIKGIGSVTVKDLPSGTYYVEEDTNWSWRFTPEENNKTVVLAGQNQEVTFTNRKSNNRWIDGGTWCRNIFGKNNVNDKGEHVIVHPVQSN